MSKTTHSTKLKSATRAKKCKAHTTAKTIPQNLNPHVFVTEYHDIHNLLGTAIMERILILSFLECPSQKK